MAEDFDKSEDATPFKLDEARKKGQVGRSTEFAGFFSLCAIVIGLYLFVGDLARIFAATATKWISSAHTIAGDLSLLSVHAGDDTASIIRVIGPILFLGVAASVLAGFVHVGVVFSLFSLKFDFSKLNPAKGLKKIFSRKSLVEIVKLALKLATFGYVAYLIWASYYPTLFGPGLKSLSVRLEDWLSLLGVLLFSILLVYFVFAVFDLWFSKKEFSRQMRMSKRDVSDEHKRQEGDPEVKSKRKKSQRELLKKVEGLANMAEADVVITNPTRFAVALKYRSKSMALPVVVAKGGGVLAKLIRRRALKLGIPIHRRPELARLLNRRVGIKEVILSETQVEVAEIYRSVMQLPHCKVNS